MKTNHFLLIALAFLFFTTKTEAQNDTRTITLVVKTDQITDTNDRNQVEFKGQPTGVENIDFTINAKVNEIIDWAGESQVDTPFEVDIKKVKYASGTDIFEKTLKGDVKVSGRIKKGNVGQVYKYKLYFRIKGERRTYTIDPKIQI